MYTSTGQGILGNNMFAYCNNNPVNYSDEDGDRADSIWGWIGGEIGEQIYEWITEDDHPNDQAEAIENEIISTQNEMIAGAVGTVWDACMWNYNQQQEAQLLEAQMINTVSPRIIEAGFEGSAGAAIATATACFLQNSQQNDPKAGATSVAISFVGGFVAGAALEIWRIFKEIAIN